MSFLKQKKCERCVNIHIIKKQCASNQYKSSTFWRLVSSFPSRGKKLCLLHSVFFLFCFKRLIALAVLHSATQLQPPRIKALQTLHFAVLLYCVPSVKHLLAADGLCGKSWRVATVLLKCQPFHIL